MTINNCDESHALWGNNRELFILAKTLSRNLMISFEPLICKIFSYPFFTVDKIRNSLMKFFSRQRQNIVESQNRR